MKSDMDQSCLYQFVRSKIREELHIKEQHTYLEEELLCSLTEMCIRDSLLSMTPCRLTDSFTKTGGTGYENKRCIF